MSIASWKAEFYPKNAAKVSKKDALAHSLRKWIGLRKENLDKHDLAKDDCDLIADDDDFSVNGDSCALCQHYEAYPECRDCPLFKALGNVRCDDRDQEWDEPPYFAFVEGDDPEPMIAALRKAQRMQKKKKRKKSS